MGKEANAEFMLWFSLHKLSEQISKHEERLFRKTSLTKTQHRILLTIAFLSESKKTPIKITDLVPYQDSGLVGVSLLVNRMVKKLLLKKVRDISDRRIVYVTMTPLGKKLLKEASNPTTDLIKHIFSFFSDTEFEQATVLINKLLRVMEQETSLATNNDMDNKLTKQQSINFLNKLGGYS